MAEAARRALGKLAGLSAAVGVVGWAFNECLYTVDGGERAVVWHRFSGGLQPGVKGEGLHYRIPFVEYPKIFDIRLRPRVIATRTGTKDLQTVQISLRVLSRPDEKFLSKIYQDLGEDYDERVLPSIVNEVLKATVANFDAEQLLTQREKVSRQIRDSLNERAAEFNLHLDDVSITHLVFSREFTQAIEAKQVAQQEAERSKFIVAKAEQEQKAAIIKAEGESEAATLISNALRTSGTAMLDIRRLEASREIADTLSQARNVVYVPNSGNMLMAMPAAGAGRGAASLA